MHPHESDFRFALAEALDSMNFDVTYVYFQKKSVVYEVGVRRRVTMTQKQFHQHMRRRFRSEKRLIVFNSTDLYALRRSLLLRLKIGGIWCFDVHDDLLYEMNGWERLKARVRQRLIVAASHIQVCAAPSLIELIPSARHLGNASNVSRIARRDIDWNKILVMSSIDKRFDFVFLRSTAERLSSMHFCIYGYIGDEPARRAVAQMTEACPNITYQGPYQNSDIQKIISNFSVMLAPYALNPLTRYIDPLRFYHGLRSGMELVSTPIPAVHTMSGLVHVVDSPDACAETLSNIANDSRCRLNVPGRPSLPSWSDKAEDLIRILDEYLMQPSRPCV